MIALKEVSFEYNSTERSAGVYDIDLEIPSGQVVMLCGASGCGKSTITRLINGLAPTYYPGRLQGQVLIDGRDSSSVTLYELSQKIGSVFQNPRSQFFSVDSTSEIAFGCENTGVSREEMYRRIGQVTRDLRMEYLLDRSLFALSGGEKQKIACASVAAMQPDIFILDEPSSNLDLRTIADLRGVIRTWKKQGKTVIIAEHRLYYLMDIIDRVIYMEEGRIVRDLSAEEFRETDENELHQRGLRSLRQVQFEAMEKKRQRMESFCFSRLSFSYDREIFLDIPKMQIPYGAIVGILGYNGAGKSTLARAICGLEKKAKGSLHYRDRDLSTRDRRKCSYMVMQDVNHQLFTESVLDEVLLSMETEDESARQRAKEILKRLNLEEFQDLHPMSLSGGQKQRVAIASAMATDKELLIFDEPTSGLDYRHMLEVAGILKQLSEEGRTLFLITHDPELVQECCDYLLFMRDGRLAWSGEWTRENAECVNRFFAAGQNTEEGQNTEDKIR
nr:energy-coupling factor ABC transporter ATP-binding protein [Shuttleworthia satelles]